VRAVLHLFPHFLTQSAQKNGIKKILQTFVQYTDSKQIDRVFTVLRPAHDYYYYHYFFFFFFYIYGDVTIAGEGLQNLDLYSVLRAFELKGIFKYRAPLAETRGLSFLVSSEGPPYWVASYV
jgi:hypothetical protein